MQEFTARNIGLKTKKIKGEKKMKKHYLNPIISFNLLSEKEILAVSNLSTDEVLIEDSPWTVGGGL